MVILLQVYLQNLLLRRLLVDVSIAAKWTKEDPLFVEMYLFFIFFPIFEKLTLFSFKSSIFRLLPLPLSIHLPVPSAVISGGPPTFQSSPFYTVKEFIGRPITLLGESIFYLQQFGFLLLKFEEGHKIWFRLSLFLPFLIVAETENYGTEKKTMMLGVVLTAAQVALLQDKWVCFFCFQRDSIFTTSQIRSLHHFWRFRWHFSHPFLSFQTLSSNGISYKVLLFCGKQILVNASCTNQRSPATVEFPSTCEVKVNGQLLSINLKGTKKSSAKVSPPDLNKDNKFTSMTGVMNKVEIVYTNASQVSNRLRVKTRRR